MVYLLGINHRLQWDKSHSTNGKFEKYIENKVVKHKIDVLAEEFSEEILISDRFYVLKKITTTTIYDVSRKLGIKHIYCDPTRNERAELGVRLSHVIKKAANINFYKLEKDYTTEEHTRYKKEREKDDEIREDFWMNQIIEYKNKNIMFCCGIQHLISFRKKLLKNGFKVLTFKEIFEDIA